MMGMFANGNPGNDGEITGDPDASLELFRQIVRDLHGRGIKVILDLPLNHAGAQGPGLPKPGTLSYTFARMVFPPPGAVWI